MNNQKTALFLVRLGVAFAFVYAAISGFISPQDWIGYFPAFMQNILPGTGIVAVWGIVELILGLWILSGKRIFIPSLLAALAMIGVILFNFAQMDVLFRDVSIALAAAGLAVWSYRLPSDGQ